MRSKPSEPGIVPLAPNHSIHIRVHHPPFPARPLLYRVRRLNGDVPHSVPRPRGADGEWEAHTGQQEAASPPALLFLGSFPQSLTLRHNTFLPTWVTTADSQHSFWSLSAEACLQNGESLGVNYGYKTSALSSSLRRSQSWLAGTNALEFIWSK